MEFHVTILPFSLDELGMIHKWQHKSGLRDLPWNITQMMKLRNHDTMKGHVCKTEKSTNNKYGKQGFR